MADNLKKTGFSRGWVSLSVPATRPRVITRFLTTRGNGTPAIMPRVAISQLTFILSDKLVQNAPYPQDLHLFGAVWPCHGLVVALAVLELSELPAELWART